MHEGVVGHRERLTAISGVEGDGSDEFAFAILIVLDAA